MLRGQMMQMPLAIASLLRHAERHAGEVEIVSQRVEDGAGGEPHRSNWRTLAQRARRCAQALDRLGCAAGDRIGTLAWNGHRHLELYYGISGSQRVCHTVNPRLFPEQIAWIINDAADRVLCFDLSFVPLVEKIAPLLGSVQQFVLMCDRAHLPADCRIPRLLCYEDLLAAEDGDYRWPDFDEQCAASICYTSGTTGHPKGAVYSHRSTVLHAMAATMPDAMALGATDVVLPVVPMFHVNAWGLPYACALVGCKLVLPGPHLDGKSLYALFEGEQVSFSAGVPTVWLGLLNHVQQHGLRFSSFKRTVIGGSTCPPSMMRSLQDDHGIEVIHAWGMTELSPLGTLSRLRRQHLSLPREQQQRLLEKQGRAIFGIDIALADDAGQALPWDGRSAGNLLVRGHWVVERYFGQGGGLIEGQGDAHHGGSPLQALDGEPGWFPTGDVATIDADGFMQITDRSKDVIKSGGEWISSIELENIAMAHPAVQEAAVVAVRHPKWDERPLLVAVLRAGQVLSREALLGHFEGRIAKWQIPDDVVFVDELPHTATGKLQKLKLRERFRDHVLPGLNPPEPSA